MQAFKKAADKRGIELKIIGGDMSATVPALLFCDETLVLPPVRDEKYIPFLADYCKKEEVDALIPTIDTDLLLLAENKGQFGATRVVVSDLEMVRICRDKRYTADYFLSIGLQSPIPVDKIEKYVGGFPAFIKPRDGSSSINAYKIENEEQLKSMVKMVPNYIIQRYIDGTEYTVDVFCDFDGNPVYITPRVRLAVRAGEVLKTEISQDQTIIEEIKRLVADYKPCGAITVQLIRDYTTGVDYYLEINPRFGGGAPLSFKAGADSADALLQLLDGKAVGYQEKAAEDGAIFSRFDQSVRVSS